MRILVVGSGGREHALAWSLHRNGENQILVVPGNPGTALFAENLQGEPVAIARERNVDLVVVGPEAPLVAGIAEELGAAGIPCFGPSSDCARLEGSKWFAKEIMAAAGVPTASGRVFTQSVPLLDYLGDNPEKYVIKADGLAAGKGVFLPENAREAEEAVRSLLPADSDSSGSSVVVEDRLTGREISILAVCNGNDAVILPPSRDHKRAFNGDRGPNTGGMGAICPPGDISPDLPAVIKNTVILPVLRELQQRGLEFRGVLYAGLMLTDSGPRVLEFNVRFGDPETQAVLPMVESDLASLFLAAAKGESLPEVKTRQGAAACVILASGGYPGNYEKGYEIKGTDQVECMIFHAGTAVKDGALVTSGGRVMGITATAGNLDEALKTAMKNAERVQFTDKHMRTDIGRTV